MTRRPVLSLFLFLVTLGFGSVFGVQLMTPHMASANCGEAQPDINVDVESEIGDCWSIGDKRLTGMTADQTDRNRQTTSSDRESLQVVDADQEIPKDARDIMDMERLQDHLKQDIIKYLSGLNIYKINRNIDNIYTHLDDIQNAYREFYDEIYDPGAPCIDEMPCGNDARLSAAIKVKEALELILENLVAQRRHREE